HDDHGSASRRVWRRPSDRGDFTASAPIGVSGHPLAHRADLVDSVTGQPTMARNLHALRSTPPGHPARLILPLSSDIRPDEPNPSRKAFWNSYPSVMRRERAGAVDHHVHADLRHARTFADELGEAFAGDGEGLR